LPGRSVGLAWWPQTGQLYGLGVNAVANTATLYLVDPQIGSVTGGAPLDFGAVAGLDIPGEVAVVTSSAPAAGSGIALSDVSVRVRR
jgi:hypothetical protein